MVASAAAVPLMDVGQQPLLAMVAAGVRTIRVAVVQAPRVRCQVCRVLVPLAVVSVRVLACLQGLRQRLLLLLLRWRLGR